MLNELMLRLMNPLTDAMLKNLLTESYPNNPMVMTTTFEKLSLRAVIEAGMRAETGKALSRPMGSPLRLSPWEKLFQIGYAGISSINNWGSAPLAAR